MLLTEDEAKTKWCPHARQAVDTSRDPAMAATANRDGTGHYGADNCNCIAAGCMAWRWAGWVNVLADGSLEPSYGFAEYHLMRGKTMNLHGCVHVGYCGAFGQAEG